MPQIVELYKKCNTITKSLAKASRINTALQVKQWHDLLPPAQGSDTRLNHRFLLRKA